MLCLVKDSSVVRTRHPGIHGCRCTIVEVPQHPNTWFKVKLHNPPDSPGKSKYESPIKVQATSLIPLGEDGKPIPVEELEADSASIPGLSKAPNASKSKQKF